MNKNIKGFSKQALKLIYEYEWPGNVREVENTIERCVIISDGEYIDKNDLPLQFRTKDDSYSGVTSTLFEDDFIIPFEVLKENAIKHALKVTNGNVIEAAKRLEISRATVYRIKEKFFNELGENK